MEGCHHCVMATEVPRCIWRQKSTYVYTTEAWGELSQTLRVEMSWLGQLQDLQMLLIDLLSLLRDNNTNETKLVNFVHSSSGLTAAIFAWECIIKQLKRIPICRKGVAIRGVVTDKKLQLRHHSIYCQNRKNRACFRESVSYISIIRHIYYNIGI